MPLFPPDPKDIGGEKKGFSRKVDKTNNFIIRINKKINPGINKMMSKIAAATPFIVMGLIFYLFIFTIFLNGKSTLRHFLYFNFVYATLSVLFARVREGSILPTQRIIYFFGFIISFIHLVFLHLSYYIPWIDDYFKRIASEKLGVLLGFIIFFCILIAQLNAYYERKT